MSTNVETMRCRQARGWGEIFSSPEEADRQYEALIDGMKQAYIGDDTFEAQTVERDAVTGLLITRLLRTGGQSTRLVRLNNGNVVITFVSPGDSHSEEIIPDVGIIDHEWNFPLILAIQSAVKDLHNQSLELDFRVRLSLLRPYLKGRLATRNWERIMSRDGGKICRVGYKIYSDKDLDRAVRFVSDWDSILNAPSMQRKTPFSGKEPGLKNHWRILKD